MGLRREREDPPTDQDLPLSVDQAIRLRRLVLKEFTRRDFDVVVERDSARDYSGTTYGLWSLATICRDVPERQWKGLVQGHLDRLLALRPGLGDITEEQLRRTVHLQLMAASAIPDPDLHPETELISEDLVSILTVARPGAVEIPPESVWKERGGLPKWETIARRNLRSLIGTLDIEHREVRTPAVAYSMVSGKSAFTSSLGLVLGDLMSHYTAELDGGLGVLVIVPTRHHLRWRVVDGPSTVATLNDMTTVARETYDAAPDPLSPHVYWVHHGRWHQVTDEGRYTVWPELRQALGVGESWPR